MSRRRRQNPATPAPAPRSSSPRAWYDFAEPFNRAGGRLRRPAQIERLGEAEGQLTPSRRLRGIDLARNMMRNSAQTRGLDRTLRVNAVGPDGKLVFADAPAGSWYDLAARAFRRWSRHADYIDGASWRECLQQVAAAIEREGDCVVVHDVGQLSGGPAEREGTGRLLFFEADQIASLDAASWAAFLGAGYAGWHQCSGVLTDALGRVAGVVVTGRRGEETVPLADALVLTRDPAAPDEAEWILLARRWRLRQLRGSASSLPALTTVQDAQEMVTYELQSAKRSASHYAAILERDQPALPQDMAALPDPATLAAGTAAAQAASPEAAAAAAATPAPAPIPGATDDMPAVGQTNLAAISGGQVDLMRGVEKIEWDPATRPSTPVVDFLDHSARLAGRAMGLNASYSVGRAEGSYTAFRGDLVMSWRTFADLQQWLEDTLCDWVARRVLLRAVRLGELPPPPDEDWPDAIRWQWPRMPAVDEDREQSAILKKLRNGLTTYRDEIGPSWRAHLEQLAEEHREAERLGLPLAPFEATPGSSSPAPTDPNPDPQT